MATRSKKAVSANPVVNKFVCVDSDGYSAVGTTPFEAFEKYESDCGCHDIAHLDFYELGARFKGQETVILSPAPSLAASLASA
jgi:hypothetical protein